jgi:nucleoside-diphosphate-sugar epimerase
LAEQGTVVVTGSSGRIGTILRQALAGKYRLRGIDRVPTPGMPGALVASLTDLGAILPAFKGADAVVHLAADPRHAPDIGWDTLIPDNVDGQRVRGRPAGRGEARRLLQLHARVRHVRERPALVPDRDRGLYLGGKRAARATR